MKHLYETIAKRLDIPVSQIGRLTYFENDLKLDSLDFLDLMLAIEKDFDVRIPETRLARFETVGDVEDWMKEPRCD